MVMISHTIRFLFSTGTISSNFSVVCLLVLVSKERIIFKYCLHIFRWLHKESKNIFLTNTKWLYIMTLCSPRKKRKKDITNFSKFLKHCILKTKKVIRILSTLLFCDIGVLSLSAGIVQYIKHFAKVLEGVDDCYLDGCWQNNVREDAAEKGCFI